MPSTQDNRWGDHEWKTKARARVWPTSHTTHYGSWWDSCSGSTVSRSSSGCSGGTSRWISPRGSWLVAAGVIETIGGALIILGLFTRPVAFILAGEMTVAYFRSHMPQGAWSIMNGGERAALYCWIYLFFEVNGAGAFSIDGLLRARRRSRVAG